ncbi:MAG: mercury transporter [Dehalococcoidia bacterium]
MRSVGRLATGLAASGVLVICCALGPAAIVAGLAMGLGGLGLGVWMVVGAGILVAGAGALGASLRRRRVGTTCASRPPVTATEGERDR